MILSANTEFLCDVIFVTSKFLMLCDSHKIRGIVTKFWIRIKRRTDEIGVLQTPISNFAIAYHSGTVCLIIFQQSLWC